MEKRFLAVMAAPSATKEQREKLMFSASIPSNYAEWGVSYELQNGLPDSVVAGIVMNIAYKDPESGEVKNIEVFSDCGDTLPFSVTGGHVGFFQAEKISKLSPTITLKDVKVRKLKD